MDREEAKKIALDAINKEIETHGEDYIFLMAPQLGKNTWTLKEARESSMIQHWKTQTPTSLMASLICISIKKN